MLKKPPHTCNKYFFQKKLILFQLYIEHMHLEKFEWLSSSEKLFKNTLHPKITYCCEALKTMLSNYLLTTQVLRGTFFKICRIQIKTYTLTSIKPKYGAFYLRIQVSVPLQSLLVQLS